MTRFAANRAREGSATDLVTSAAEFSPCGRYRYSLTRVWDRERPTILFIGLNPSTADAEKNDTTIRRCIGFARSWRFGGLIVCNLFALRSTDPRVLRVAADPVGPGNAAAIRRACGMAGRVVVAWGVHGRLHRRDEHVLAMIERPFCLGVTQDGSPRHPLYLSVRTRLRRCCRCNRAAHEVSLRTE